MKNDEHTVCKAINQPASACADTGRSRAGGRACRLGFSGYATTKVVRPEQAEQRAVPTG
jgi:hypothetical protein